MNRTTRMLPLAALATAGVFVAPEIEDACVRITVKIATMAVWAIAVYVGWPRRQQARTEPRRPG